MKVYNIVLVVIYVDFVSSDSSNETTVDVKLLKNVDNPVYKTLWELKPRDQPLESEEDDSPVRYMTMKEPRVLTRLAKSLIYRYEPFFSRDIFGTFERRSRPITLVAIRKQGLPREQVKVPKLALEVAELQSPYNDKSDALLMDNLQ